MITVDILHKWFFLEMDKYPSSSNPNFLRSEVDYFINQAVDITIKTKYSGNNSKGTSFQQNQKRSDDLRTLVKSKGYKGIYDKNGESSTGSNIHHTIDSNEYSIKYPNDYMFGLGETAYISPTSKCNQCSQCGDKVRRTDVIECTVENLDQKLDNSLSDHRCSGNGKPRPLRVYTNGYIKLYTDDNYKIDRYVITYLKAPKKIKWNPINTDANHLPILTLPEHLWMEIIVLASAMALENISESRYQTYSQKLSITE